LCSISTCRRSVAPLCGHLQGCQTYITFSDQMIPSFLTPPDHAEDDSLFSCGRPASRQPFNDHCLGINDLNAVSGGTTISAAHLFQSRSAAGLSGRRAATGVSQPGIWRAERSSPASARDGPAPTWRRHGLATWVLELGQTRLGVGIRPLRLPPVRTRELDLWSLEPTTRRLGLGAGALAMIFAIAPGHPPPFRGLHRLTR